MDPSADAEAFLLGLEKAGDAGTTVGQPQPGAELNHAGTEQMNGQVSDGLGNGTAGPAANGYTSSGRRNKWGSVMEVKEEPPKPQKKRRSRWEEVPEENTDTTLAVVPKEITICGGIRVSILTPVRLLSMLNACPLALDWSPARDPGHRGPHFFNTASCRRWVLIENGHAGVLAFSADWRPPV